MTITLIGHKSAGKTTIGKSLAKQLGWQFVDTDKLLRERYDNSKTVASIFAELGEKRFRELEKEVIKSLIADELIIATGGGALLNYQNAEHLQQLGGLVYLKTKLDTLLRRNTKREQQGVLAKKTNKEEDYLKRDELYSCYADLVLDCDDKTVKDIVQEILTQTCH